MLDPNHEKWRDMRVRTLSAAVMIPIVVLCLWWGGFVFMIALWAVGMVAAYEWCRLVYTNMRRIQTGLYQAAVTVSVSPMLIGNDTITIISAVLLILLLWGVGQAFFSDARINRPSLDVSSLFTLPAIGSLYIPFAILSVSLLRLDASHGFTLLVGMIIVIAAADTMALVFGRSLGGPKLAPVISPNKTWAGVGGLALGACGSGLILSAFIDHDRSVLFIAAISVGVALGAHAGDIAQSYVKRKAKVKDSGTLIPGHGGVLDRVDSHFTAALILIIIGLVLGGVSAPARAILIGSI